MTTGVEKDKATLRVEDYTVTPGAGGEPHQSAGLTAQVSDHMQGYLLYVCDQMQGYLLYVCDHMQGYFVTGLFQYA